MYQTVMEQLSKQLSEKQFEEIKGRKIHLGIFMEPGLSDIMGGKRTIEARFGKNRSAPYGQIAGGDIVVMKKTGGSVSGYFTVGKAEFLCISEISMPEIKLLYNDRLRISDELWELKKDSRYATLIFIDEVRKLDGFGIPKKGMQTWIVLNK